MGTKMENEARKQGRERTDGLLLAQVTESFTKIGKDYVRIRDDLNARGVRTPKGKEWTRENIQKYVARYIVKKAGAQDTLVTATKAAEEITKDGDITNIGMAANGSNAVTAGKSTKTGNIATGLMQITKAGNVTKEGHVANLGNVAKEGHVANLGNVTKGHGHSSDLVTDTNIGNSGAELAMVTNLGNITKMDSDGSDLVISTSDRASATNVGNATIPGNPASDVESDTNVGKATKGVALDTKAGNTTKELSDGSELVSLPKVGSYANDDNATNEVAFATSVGNGNTDLVLVATTKVGNSNEDMATVTNIGNATMLGTLTSTCPEITNEDSGAHDQIVDLVTPTNATTPTSVTNGTKPPGTPKATSVTNDSEAAMQALIDLYESGVIPKIVAWWESHVSQGCEPPAMDGRRPVIRGGKTRNGKKKWNTGIQVDVEVLERAEAKMKAEAVATGGSLSKLVELLLWQYIGSPRDLVRDD